MNVFYKPKKSTAPCSGGSTDSSITTVPKKNLFFSMFKRLLPLMILFIWTESSAQFSFYPSWWVHSHYVLEWDPYVGCSQPSTRFDEIIPDRCMRACKGSTVEYFVKDYIINMAWGDPEEFTIDWTVTGGTVMDVYDETDPQYGIKIKWSDTAHTGSIKIEVYTDSYYRLYWLCVRLINNPIADFEIIGEGEFCKNSPIFFNNLSVANGYGGIKSTLWDFGDGNYSSQYHPQHSYEQPGSYVVTLTVTNWCNCESIYKMTLTVVEKPAPIISCPGVVVEKETVTYTTEDPCGGKWIAEGGTIIDGGSGDYATIVWDGIDPAEGFGYIHYFSECTCPTTVKVPVVTKRALIKGDPFICEGVMLQS